MALRLSIIIPFYNVERYIAECLDSVFDQDIPLEEYEVICVNDGSPDGSRDIVVEYMKRYPNLHLVEHDRNRKLGAARNTGRAAAKGEYIWNVDSDDKIVSRCLGKLLKICGDNHLDVLEFGTIKFWDDKEGKMRITPKTETVMKGLDYLEQLTTRGVSRLCTVWRRLIRRDFLEENHIFSPEINMGEDVPYSFRVLMKAKRFMAIPEWCYMYRVNPDSLTGQNWKPTSPTLYEKCFIDSRLIYDVAVEVPKDYVNVRMSYFNAARYTLSRYDAYVACLDSSERKAFRTLCRNHFRENRFVKELLTKKGYAFYLLWLLGIKSLPK